MIESREKELLELEAKAKQMLDSPRLLPNDNTTRNFLPTLHLWISPVFSLDKHWIFYKPRPQINPQPKSFIRQIVWKKDDDFQRLNNPLIGLKEGFHPEPTFEIKTVEIEKEAFEKTHFELAKIHLPAFVQDEFLGLDGEHFGVETLGFYHSAKILWWSSYPKEWQLLIDWFEKTVDFIKKKFDDH